MSWLDELFGVTKPIIGMCHMPPLPGDPHYNEKKGMKWILDKTRKELLSLLSGGVDGVMFANEFSQPYLVETERITSVSMAYIIGKLKHEIKLPFGISVLWDSMASIDIAIATRANFIRAVSTGVYGSDFGYWNTSCGELVRHRHHLYGDNIKIMQLIPKAAGYIGNRSFDDVIQTVVFNTQPDALCVSGLIAGSETSTEMLSIVKRLAPSTPIVINTGLTIDNIDTQMPIADAAIVGTAFKRNGDIKEDVDEVRVKNLMIRINDIRMSNLH